MEPGHPTRHERQGSAAPARPDRPTSAGQPANAGAGQPADAGAAQPGDAGAGQPGDAGAGQLRPARHAQRAADAERSASQSSVAQPDQPADTGTASQQLSATVPDQRAGAGPASQQASAAQPGAAQPGTVQPGAAQPGAAQPGAAQSSTVQPGTAQPGTAQAAPASGPVTPPRPRNRRGWMSDAPLDGGSGWPTSAYAIVQRPDPSKGATPAQERPTQAAASPEAPSPSSAPPAQRNRRAARQPRHASDPKRDTQPDHSGEPQQNHAAGDPPRSVGQLKPAYGVPPETSDWPRHANGGSPHTNGRLPHAGSGSTPANGRSPLATSAGASPLAGSAGVSPRPPHVNGRSPQLGAAHEPAPPRHQRWVFSGAAAILLAVAVVAGIVVATRAAAPDTGTAAVTGPKGVAATTQAGGRPDNLAAGPTSTASVAPSASTVGAAGAAGASPAASGSAATDVLHAGTVRLSSILGRPAEAFDLDSGTKAEEDGFGAGQRPDVLAGAKGLAADSSAQFAVWSLPGAPTAAGCAAIPATLWSPVMVVTPLALGPVLCVRTDQGRLAAITPRVAPAGGEAALYTTLVDFTVWRTHA